MMRKINVGMIEEKVAEMCLKAAFDLPEDALSAVNRALASESSERGRMFLAQYLENAKIAREEKLPICQDTGVAVFFVELGQEVHIEGGTLEDAIEKGTAKGYKDGYLRGSIVNDPLFDRKNTGTNTPPIMHLKLVSGDGLKITLAPKGGGSENMSAVKMLKPYQGVNGVIEFVVETVCSAGGNPCPPTVVGVGIGGSLEMCAILAKKALLRKIGASNTDERYARLESEILAKINASGLGPQALGGINTSFAVHIEYFPCHIASLPVAVNINCHASRHAEIKL